MQYNNHWYHVSCVVAFILKEQKSKIVTCNIFIKGWHQHWKLQYDEHNKALAKALLKGIWNKCEPQQLTLVETFKECKKILSKPHESKTNYIGTWWIYHTGWPTPFNSWKCCFATLCWIAGSSLHTRKPTLQLNCLSMQKSIVWTHCN